MTTVSIAVEGLPGSGKTSLVQRLSQRCRRVEVINELFEGPPAQPGAAFFARNDMLKEAALNSSHSCFVVLDRYWPSTVAYRLAETRLMNGQSRTVREVEAELYGRHLLDPTVWVLLDSGRSLADVYRSDQLWPDPRFRRMVRDAYFDIVRSSQAPVYLVPTSERASTDNVSYVLHALLHAHASSHPVKEPPD